MIAASRVDFAPSDRMFFKAPSPVILSPCIGVCTLDAVGCCRGCYRTLEEIAGWSSFSDNERLRIMNEILPVREQQRTQV